MIDRLELPTLVVFSHLRWDFVYQRPQHLLSRIANNRPVLFIEEPIFQENAPAGWEITTPSANVNVARPALPVGGVGFGDEQLPLLKPMVNELLQERGITDYVVWLYTPMALPLAQSISREPLAVVYDCMDELSAFRFAPLELVERENKLMHWADLVLTGGRSLYTAKRSKHHNVHCFPSSVDVGHFAPANGRSEPDDQSKLPHPRLGWFGVIDERFDPAIVRAMADAHPEWSIIIVGPIVKIDPDSLPKNANIHYMGARTYDVLPAYMAGWDVCIQPFALNESTRFISPTKTLEYMASDLPIVSTPVKDVVDQYSDIVYIGDGPEAFVTACERALAEPPGDRSNRIGRTQEILAGTSWSKTASAIEDLIIQASAKHAMPVA